MNPFKKNSREFPNSHFRVFFVLLFLFSISFTSINLNAQGGNCACWRLGPNLALEPDFPTGCTPSYQSDLTWAGCNTITSQNQFTEGPNASLINGSWTGTDNTGNGSNFLIFDGPTIGPVTQDAWRQTVEVNAGRTYRFSAWVMNILTTTTGSPAFRLRFNGTDLLPGSGAFIPPASGQWYEICGIFIPATSGSAQVSISVDRYLSHSVNDGGIDDIRIEEMRPSAFFYAYDGIGTVIDENVCLINQPLTFAPIQQDHPNDRHIWNFDDGTSDFNVTPSHTYVSPGTYTVTHTYLSSNCGVASYTYKVTIKRCDDCCSLCGPNLVQNGDFGAATCFVGYTSQMGSVACPNGNTAPGFYTETSDANLIYPNDWCGKDHSPGGGTRFLVADAHESIGKEAWQQTVPVTPGQRYCFRAWIKNLDLGPNSAYPTVELRVGASTANYKIVAKHNGLRYAGCCDGGWEQICGTWIAPEGVTQAILSIFIGAGPAKGTDLGIDDIEFALGCSSGLIREDNNHESELDQSFHSFQELENTSTIPEEAGKIEDKSIVYPVPVARGEILKIELNSFEGSKIKVRIVDMQGRIVGQFNEKLQKGVNTISLKTGNLPQGHYIVEIGKTKPEKHTIIVTE